MSYATFINIKRVTAPAPGHEPGRRNQRLFA